MHFLCRLMRRYPSPVLMSYLAQCSAGLRSTASLRSFALLLVSMIIKLDALRCIDFFVPARV